MGSDDFTISAVIDKCYGYRYLFCSAAESVVHVTTCLIRRDIFKLTKNTNKHYFVMFACVLTRMGMHFLAKRDVTQINCTAIFGPVDMAHNYIIILSNYGCLH